MRTQFQEPKPAPASVEDWQERAECTKRDPEMFFAPDGMRNPQRKEFYDRARSICAVCPVQRECFAAAVKDKPTDGVWAGVVFRLSNSRSSLLRDRERFILAVARGKYRKPTESLPPVAPTTKRRKEYRAKEDRRKELEAMLQSPEWHEMEATLNV